ncbi:conjugal transfer protein [Photobacterium kishitanii]|nr:conjugal transfer protein [Photobacterium kishitanii]KJG61139.1 conjugal transfer protein [Photobacterium kishitanii]KJG65304.1 conjugal transfer protein [Photobacterium kishitanii]
MRFISTKNRHKLYVLLSDLIDDGIPLYDALEMMYSDGKNVYDKKFINDLSIIVEKIKNVSSVTTALNGLIPESELIVLNASEKAGQLSQGFRLLALTIEKNIEIKKLLLGSLVTPLLLFNVILIIISGYSLQVFPTFLNVLPYEKWPSVTQLLYSFGYYLYNGGYITILVVSTFICFILYKSLSFITGSIRDNVLDKLPPFNYYKGFQVVIFLRLLSTLMINGIPISDAIKLLEERSSRWLKYHLKQFSENMNKGISYKDALNTGLLSNEMLLTVSLYSSLSSFNMTVCKMADNSEFKIIETIKKLTSVLKNISLVMLAGAVIWIFSAIFSLVDKLGSSFS